MDGDAKRVEISFVIDCSDRRNAYLFDALKNDGYRVFRRQSGTDYRLTGGGVFLFAPTAVVKKEDALEVPPDCRVFCFDRAAEAADIFSRNGVSVHRYFDDERLAVKNAYLTAEGALAVIINNTDRSVKGMRALILGCGRVGKSVAKVLCDNRCRVFATTVDPAEYAYISDLLDGVYDFCEYPAHLGEFDLIVNTVPEQILKGEKLGKIQKDCLVLDLASAPGGVDHTAAAMLGLKTMTAPGLPAKTAPRSAGLALKESVLWVLGRCDAAERKNFPESAKKI